jgi:hypothetical protein
MRLNAAASQRLAYYQSEHGAGVLAPRGWHGFGGFGSMGTSLQVVPFSIDSEKDEFVGPVIIVNSITGETSGRVGCCTNYSASLSKI